MFIKLHLSGTDHTVTINTDDVSYYQQNRCWLGAQGFRLEPDTIITMKGNGENTIYVTETVEQLDKVFHPEDVK